MSIINDALKKTQERLRFRSTPLPAHTMPKEETNLLFWITSTLILGCFLGSSLVFFFFIHTKDRPLLTSTIKQDQTSPSEVESLLFPPPTPTSVPKTTRPAATLQPHDSLVLNGIVTMGNDRYALINNEIYRAGDFIEDKQVLSISEDKVQILDQGNIRTLSTKLKR